MGITIEIPTKKYNIESKYKFTYKRKRLDIAKVLEELKNGNKLYKMFPIYVAQSLNKQFQDNCYIDTENKVLQEGLNFINHPFKREHEESIYSVDFMEFDLEGYRHQLVVNMTRRLSNDERQISQFNFNPTERNNELQINDEKIYFDSLVNIANSKTYIGKESNGKITFDITSQKYNAGYGDKESGDIGEDIKEYVMNYLDVNNSYVLDSNLNIIVNELSDFANAELLKGLLTSRKIENITLTNLPLIIENLEVAKKYAYLYMYNKISSGEYLSSSEMNETFVNEVLSSTIISENIKDKLQSFTYSEDGFKKYLDQNKYSDLQYKLNVMKLLLNYDIREEKLKNVRDYRGVASYLASVVSPSDVKKVNLVLGYATADTKTNKIIDCIEALQEKYNSIEIISKNDGSNQKTSNSIRESILKHGVQIKTNVEIGKSLHDRYVAFELKDGTYKIMLATNDIGQFFNIETMEPKGTIMLINNDEVVKSGKSLIEMIKEAK